MGVWQMSLAVHVLSVCLATGLSVKVKDAARHGAGFHKYAALNSRSSLKGSIPEFRCDGYDSITGKDTPACGDGFCKCTDTLADCSHNDGNLTYVPAFPTNILWLGFAHNGLVSIPEFFFQNVTHLTSLELSFNDLHYISPGAFDILRQLSTLKLNLNNKLTYATLAPVLSITTLKQLDLNQNELGPLPGGIFNNYRLRQLEFLCLAYNNMKYVNMTVFTPLENLTHLDLSDNQLSMDSFHTACLPHLFYIGLAGNFFTSYVDTCRDGNSVFPNLKFLELSGNTGWDTLQPDSLCLPRLQCLDLHYIFFILKHVTISQDSFNEKLFPEILEVQFSPDREGASFTIEKYAFRNPTLKSLLIEVIDFSSEKIDSRCFAGCPNLRYLVLDRSDFTHVHEEKFNHLFSQIPELFSLSLVSTGISRVTATMFRNLNKLHWLSLASNSITVISDGVFDALTTLTFLDLSTNSISMVKEKTFSADLRQRLKYLWVSNNSFQCSCELMWFQRWLTSDPALFNNTGFDPALFNNTGFDKLLDHPFNTYTCNNLPNTTVQSFYMADQACLWSPDVSKYIIATIVILMFPLAFGITLYRYRWHIRLVLFEANRGRRDRWRRLHEQHFRYDVFVSYDKEDLNWVQGHLMPELEDKMGLRLCIHQRDFIIGNPIVENIMESVQISKKIMMVFSSNFVHSHWCQFELQLCLNHVMEQGDSLLVVLLHDIPSRDLTPAMMAVMKTTTYIEWDFEPEARESFWGRILLALNEILPAV